jgi:hypothetical protein
VLLRGMMAFLISALAWGQDRPAEPDPAAQKEKLKAVKDLFKAEYARKSPADQLALAKQLILRGLESKDDPVAQCVMLKEARDLAAAAGDIETALKAVDELARRFTVQAIPQKLSALAKAAASGRDPELTRSAARAYLALVSEAVRADDYESATAAAGKAEALGRSVQDPVIPGKAQEFLRDLSALKAEYQRVKSDLDKPSPSDPEASGRYHCLVRGAWEPGLLLLSLGSGALKAAVEKDLAKPVEAEKQIEAGDGWWDHSQKEKSPWKKARMVERAQYWYEQAAATATGLAKVKADKRLAEIEELQPGSINLVRLIDVKQEPHGEWTVDGSSLLSPEDPLTRVLIPYAPPEEFDLTATVERLQGSDAVVLGFTRGTIAYAVWIDGFSNLGGRSGLELVDGVLFDKNAASIQGPQLANNRPATVVVSVRKSAITATVDGKGIVAFQGNFNRLNGLNVGVWKIANWKGLYLGTCGSRYRLSKVFLTPLSGPGKRLR